jgi:2-keto-4-pentenoate hydratase/2-oxohepta-3-ene-1,7-dioic acid hydratase in catechol pathway
MWWNWKSKESAHSAPPSHDADVIAFRLDLQPKVRRGDVVELEIEGIGTLRTPVA